MNKIKINTRNLIGDLNHKGFLELQSLYGFAQRGGSSVSNYSDNHAKRIASDVNFLNSNETKKLIFNQTVYNN